MWSKIAVITFCLAVSSTFCKAETPVRRCSGNKPFPLHVQIEDCQKMPCEVTKGRINSMDMQFVATKDESFDLKAEIHATVFGITLPYLLSEEAADVCGNLMHGANCPLYATEDVVFHIGLPVENSYPEVSLKTEVKIVDSNKDVVSCFVADLKVIKAK